MSRVLSFRFWDVQHGNATHIVTPNGRVIVVDLGDADSPSGVSRFSPINYLRFNEGYRTLDKLVITHPHRDHLDDIENAVSMHPSVLHRPSWLTEADVRQGNRQEDGAKVSQYLELSSRYNAPVPRPNDSGFPEDWGGVKIVHYASEQVSRDNLNNHSIVTFFEFSGLKALIPGDNEAVSWKALLKDSRFLGELPSVDLFLAPHHGREAGYCQELFEAGLKPRITIISDHQQGSTSVTGK